MSFHGSYSPLRKILSPRMFLRGFGMTNASIRTVARGTKRPGKTSENYLCGEDSRRNQWRRDGREREREEEREIYEVGRDEAEQLRRNDRDSRSATTRER